MLVRAERAGGLVAVAEAAQVRRDQRVAVGEPRHDRLPGQPELRPAVQQQQRPPRASPGHMERGAIGLNVRCSIVVAPVFRGLRRILFTAPCLVRHPRLEHAPTATG